VAQQQCAPNTLARASPCTLLTVPCSPPRCRQTEATGKTRGCQTGEDLVTGPSKDHGIQTDPSLLSWLFRGIKDAKKHEELSSQVKGACVSAQHATEQFSGGEATTSPTIDIAHWEKGGGLLSW